MSTRSIHFRLISLYTILIVCVSAGFGAYTYYNLRGHLYEAAHSMLQRRAEHIRSEILPAAIDNPDTLKRQIEEIYSPEESNRFIRITKTGDQLVYASGQPHDRSFDPAIVPPVENNAGDSCRQKIVSGSDNDLILVDCGAELNGADYMIEMGTPTTEINEMMHRLILTLLIGLPIGAFLAIVGGLFLVRYALKPVEAIRATAEQITFGNPHQRLPTIRTDDAIESLSKTLNRMLERLDQAYQQASRFSADASHELRTPLTIIRSEIEAILRRESSPDLRDRLSTTLEETERLSSIVESLFAIAQLDAGETKEQHEIFDFAALVRSTIEQMQLVANEKQLSVAVDASQCVLVSGDESRMKQVVVNIFDNAIKYTPTGGSIAFFVQAANSKAILIVKDSGIGISEQALPHVFERFYRANKTGSRLTQGAGLGLSIVQAICLAHGGNVRIESAEGKGTTVIIELPLAIDGEDKLHAAA